MFFLHWDLINSLAREDAVAVPFFHIGERGEALDLELLTMDGFEDVGEARIIF